MESDFTAAYVWRGIVLDQRPVVQPWAWISGSRLTLAAWSAVGQTPTADRMRLHGSGLVLTYSRDWNKLTIEPAIEVYRNRRWEDFDGRDTMEGSLKLAYQLGPLHIFTTHSFDVLAYKGSYFAEAGLGYERHVTRKTALAFNLRSGWGSSRFNETYIGLDTAAWNFLGAEISLTHHVTPYLYFRPHCEFSGITAQRLREQLLSPTILNFGLALGVEF